jgi:rhodanese-related sulfurtransferase
MGQYVLTRLNKRKLLLGVAASIVLGASSAGSVLIAAPALLPWTLDPTNPRVSLEDIERKVIRRYRMPQITPASLAEMLANGKVTLLDVRSREEFDAGHLPGAIRVEPGATAEEIIKLHGDRLDDGPVVFYCAVGVRSSRMMVQTRRQIAPLARYGAYNLRGGVFRWTADGRPMVRGGEQGVAHPFNDDWGELLARTLKDQRP